MILNKTDLKTDHMKVDFSNQGKVDVLNVNSAIDKISQRARYLYLKNCQLNSLSEIHSIEKLELVDLSGNLQLKIEDIISFAKRHIHLKSIYLDYIDFNSDQIRLLLKNTPNLKELTLYSNFSIGMFEITDLAEEFKSTGIFH